MKCCWLVIVACFTGLVGWPIHLHAAAKPNVVFILADDLGVNDLSCYGRRDQHTPHLDRLATQGVRFTCAYCAQPICSPSRAAIMTGRAPSRLHLTTYLPGRPDCPSQKLLHPEIRQQLPLEETTLAEHLHGAGYATACIGKWHLGGAGFGPQDQGFNEVHAVPGQTKPSEVEGGKGEYGLTEQAVKFIRDNRERPFFLYLCHHNPHIPLVARPGLVEKYAASFNPIYAAMMETLDDAVNRVLTTLDELRLADNTIVIFTSDNGGLHVLEFGPTPATHNTPFRAGKGFLYEGGLRIPLLVRWPAKIKPGREEATPVLHQDWAPTLLEMCGVDSKVEFDGVSLAGMLCEETPLAERSLFWHFPHYCNQGGRPSGAMREGDWKLLSYYDTNEFELYNLKTDASERANAAAAEPARVERMQAELVKWRKAVHAQENQPNPNCDPALFHKLYVETDISRVTPLATSLLMEAQQRPWRDGMNAVLPGKKK